MIRRQNTWAANGLTLTDLGDAVLVEQNGRRYKARRWRLTDEVIALVDLAIQHGLTVNWVEGHPSQPYLDGGDRFEKGIHHITFARDHTEPWVFVLGGEAKPPDINVVTFNSKLADHIHRTGIPYRWEHAGGHNVFVALSDVAELLARLPSSAIDEMGASRLPAAQRLALLPRRGLSNEMDVEIAFRERLRGAPTRLLPVEVRPHHDGKFPDVVLDLPGEALIVVELKFARAGHAALDQLLGYLRLPTIVRRAQGRTLAGVLVARSFAAGIAQNETSLAQPVSLYRYGYDAFLQLDLVAGPRTLEAHGLF